jgi:hypothetical protein
VVRGRPHLVVATVVALVLAACSADPGPPETSAADAPVRATTTTLPPPPTQERVALESAVLAGEGDQRMVAAATGVVPGEGVRVVAVGSSEGRPVAWWSPDGRTWQRSLPDPAQFGEDASFADVAADPVAGGWVAVGAEGGQAAAWLSPDGVSWERATVDPGPGMSRIGATGAGFVAFGTGGGGDPGRDGGEETAAWQSFSGQRWVRAVDDPELFARPGAERVVAVVDTGDEVQAVVEREGQGPEVWRSEDGLFWSSAPLVGSDLLPAAGEAGAEAAVALGSAVAMVGTDAKDDGVDAALWFSTGAEAFQQVAHDEAVLGGDGTQAMVGLARHRERLVAVGTETDEAGDVDAVVWSLPLGLAPQRSDDGGVAVPGDQHVVDVAVLGTTPVAVGWEESGGGLDAAVWVVGAGADDDAPVRPGAEDAGGAGGTGSPPGPALGWERVPPAEAWVGPGEQRMDSVAVAGRGVVAVGSASAAGTGDLDAAVWRSVDGREWNRASAGGALGGPGDQGMRDVVAGPAGLVAVGTDGGSAAVWTSDDGEVWQRRDHDEAVFGGSGDQRMEAVAVLPDGAGWLAVGSSAGPGDLDAAVWRSVDGQAWNRVPDDGALGGPGDQGMRDVVAGPAGLVAVGTDGGSAAAWTSTDATTWTPADLGAGQASGVTAGAPGMLAAVGAAGGEGADGAVWRLDLGSAGGWEGAEATELGGPLDQELAAVTESEGLLVAVGRSTLGGGDDAAAWASSDGGATWVRSPHLEEVFGGDQAQRMLDVATSEGLVVAVGWSGSTPESRDAAVWITDLAGGGARSNL